jgi:hypothetical protein
LVAGEAILVPIRKQVSDLNSIFALNETAAATWDLLDGQNTLQTVLEKIVAEYQVDESVAAQDLQALIAKFVELDVVEKV